jgi:hypothetical protein
MVIPKHREEESEDALEKAVEKRLSDRPSLVLGV